MAQYFVKSTGLKPIFPKAYRVFYKHILLSLKSFTSKQLLGQVENVLTWKLNPCQISLANFLCGRKKFFCTKIKGPNSESWVPFEQSRYYFLENFFYVKERFSWGGKGKNMTESIAPPFRSCAFREESRVAFELRVAIHGYSLRHGRGLRCRRHFDKYFMKNVTSFVTMLEAL